MNNPPEVELRFAGFRMRPATGELFAGDRPVPLGPRAFEILRALVESAGELVSKDALLARVWPSTVVEENTLYVHISAIRQALGDEGAWLRTVPRRGYRLEVQVQRVTAEPGVDARSRRTLPQALSPLIGREHDLFAIPALLASYRLVTLSGAAGIGKTRLGLEAARQASAVRGEPATLVDLTSVAQGRLVDEAIAAALDVEPGGPAALERAAAALGTAPHLLVLDDCHVTEHAARAATRLLRACPGLRVLATSRQPLHADGEFVYRVPPLALPPDADAPPAELLEHGAVKLFVTRAQHLEPRFPFDASTAPAIVEICTSLDGIPLAIELAAARALVLGVDGVRARLADRFALLQNASPTALARHRTLRAAIDWSYEQLGDNERSVLASIACFAHAFPLDAAIAVSAQPGVDVEAALAELVLKSMLEVEYGEAGVRYKLLQSMRAYALEKLLASGRAEEVSRRHAAHVAAALERIAAQPGDDTVAAWTSLYAPLLPDLRAALDWAFRPQGEALLGGRLAMLAVPLWMRLSMLEEACEWLEVAANVVAAHGGDEALEMRLYAALGGALHCARGPRAAAREAWERAQALAKQVGDDEADLAAHWGLWSNRVAHGDMAGAALHVEALRARPQVPGQALDYLEGMLHFYRGEVGPAAARFERMIASPPPDTSPSPVSYMRGGLRLAAASAFAQTLWMMGRPEEAAAMVHATVEEVAARGDPFALAYVLGSGGFRVALQVGDLERAERYVAWLKEIADRHGFAYWARWSRTFEAMLRHAQGRHAEAVPGLQAAIAQLQGNEPWLVPVWITLAEALAQLWRREEALVHLDQAESLSRRSGVRWYFPEVLRVKAELHAGRDTAHAERLLDEALQEAARQEALTWELRAALSMARLLAARGRRSEALSLVAPVYARYRPGPGSREAAEAQALLAPESVSRGGPRPAGSRKP